MSYTKYEVRIYDNGDKKWYLNDQLHREDGPALEWASGDKYWYLNNKLHRTNGPATEFANGSECWYLNGQLHRTDGPAVKWANGYKAWYLNGKRYDETEYNAKVQTKDCANQVVTIDGVEYALTPVTKD